VRAPVGIVGAGAAGVGAAYALRDTDSQVVLLEKSRGVSGRAATRRSHGCRYDHGANYLKDPDRRTERLLELLGTEGRHRIEEPVWTFDRAGRIEPSDRQEPKWTWEAGITQFATRVLAETDARLELETRVESIVHEAGRWLVVADDGRRLGPFGALVLTPPAPQTAGLLSNTGYQDEHLAALREAVGTVTYRSVLSVLLHYPFELDQPWYALVNTDKEHDVGWVSREECKPGHVPPGESLLVVQLSPDRSRQQFDRPLDQVADETADAVADLVGDDVLREPDWVDDQRWRYALPNRAAPTDVVRRAETDGLYFAGDWVVGEGRVHAAFWNGVAVGERVATRR
jgi:hypothetical protein